MRIQIPLYRDNSLQDEVHLLQLKMTDDELAVNIRREFVYSDAMREAHKKKFDAKKQLQVWFFAGIQ